MKLRAHRKAIIDFEHFILLFSSRGLGLGLMRGQMYDVVCGKFAWCCLLKESPAKILDEFNMRVLKLT